jgi:hypothetical protein
MQKIYAFLHFLGACRQQKHTAKNGPINFKDLRVFLNPALLKKPATYGDTVFYLLNICVNLGMDTAPIIKPEWVPSAYTEKVETAHKTPAPVNTPQPAIRQLTEKPLRKASGLRKRK